MTTVYVNGKRVEVDPAAANELINLRGSNQELLAALKALLDPEAFMGQPDAIKRLAGGSINGMARAAIAKAEGK